MKEDLGKGMTAQELKQRQQAQDLMEEERFRTIRGEKVRTDDDEHYPGMSSPVVTGIAIIIALAMGLLFYKLNDKVLNQPPRAPASQTK